jgi:hypothetical protein
MNNANIWVVICCCGLPASVTLLSFGIIRLMMFYGTDSDSNDQYVVSAYFLTIIGGGSSLAFVSYWCFRVMVGYRYNGKGEERYLLN